jgi:5-deoxy-glucuronate isomerase
MEFGVMVMSPGERREDFSKTDERVWLLVRGSASIFLGAEGDREVSRPNLFDYSPWRLSVPAGRRIVITAGTEGHGAGERRGVRRRGGR